MTPENNITKRIECHLRQVAQHQRGREQVRLLADACAELHKKQCVIDSLMFEFCPIEMTAEQVANYELHQKAVK